MTETPITYCCGNDDQCAGGCDCRCHALTRELAAARANLDTLLARIRDDALAVSCQTIGQYRTALLARTKEPQR